MTIREYLRDRQSGLLLHLVSMAALAAFLRLTGTSGGIIWIILCVWALGIAITQTACYLKTKARLEELEGLMDHLDQKYLFTECVEKPKNSYERKLFGLMRQSGRAMIEAVSDAQAVQQDYREYIESWVHEIKAPITAAELICRSLAPDIRRKLMPELASVEDHVERALFYARAESMEKDFLIRQTPLDQVVTQAVEKHRALLIQSGVRVETTDLKHTVYTDGKWAGFMVGQLLQNAVRYRREEPIISISARPLGQQVQLMVRDNGIGIPSHELHRIFDRGFSGSNGRSRGGSTGMGLYICRRLAAHMSVDIRAQSEPGWGTEVTITFPSRENLSKL